MTLSSRLYNYLFLISGAFTLVLWRKKDDEIVLFDPNNSNFSRYLTPLSATQQAALQQTVPGQKLLVTGPLFSNRQSKMYYVDSTVVRGYSGYQVNSPRARDCTDLSAKICFEIHRLQNSSTPLNKIEENVVLALTNQKVQEKSIKDKLNDTVIRELQGSDPTNAEPARAYINTNSDKINNLNSQVPIKTLSFQSIKQLVQATP